MPGKVRHRGSAQIVCECRCICRLHTQRWKSVADGIQASAESGCNSTSGDRPPSTGPALSAAPPKHTPAGRGARGGWARALAFFRLRRAPGASEPVPGSELDWATEAPALPTRKVHWTVLATPPCVRLPDRGFSEEGGGSRGAGVSACTDRPPLGSATAHTAQRTAKSSHTCTWGMMPRGSETLRKGSRACPRTLKWSSLNTRLNNVE